MARMPEKILGLDVVWVVECQVCEDSIQRYPCEFPTCEGCGRRFNECCASSSVPGRCAECDADAQGGLCGICGDSLPEDEAEIHVDHIVPVSRGGGDGRENLQATHAFCNLSKGATT